MMVSIGSCKFKDYEIKMVRIDNDYFYDPVSVGEALGYKQLTINRFICTSSKDCKLDLKELGVQYKYRNKRQLFFTKEGVLELCSTQTKRNVEFINEFLTALGIMSFPAKQRVENKFVDVLREQLAVFNIAIQPQHHLGRYFIDVYIPSLHVAIEYDEEYHNQRKVEDAEREDVLVNELFCIFIRLDSRETDSYNSARVIKRLFDIGAIY